jgi:hypothetical protein
MVMVRGRFKLLEVSCTHVLLRAWPGPLNCVKVQRLSDISLGIFPFRELWRALRLLLISGEVLLSSCICGAQVRSDA